MKRSSMIAAATIASLLSQKYAGPIEVVVVDDGSSDETIDIVTGCGEMRGASLDMIQEARRGDDLLVRAELLIACMGERGRPARLPAQARSALQTVVLTGESPRSRHIRI